MRSSIRRGDSKRREDCKFRDFREAMSPCEAHEAHGFHGGFHGDNATGCLRTNRTHEASFLAFWPR